MLYDRGADIGRIQVFFLVLELNSAFGTFDLLDHPIKSNVRERRETIFDCTATDIGVSPSKPNLLYIRTFLRLPGAGFMIILLLRLPEAGLAILFPFTTELSGLESRPTL
jgi:hypothetical protein